MKHLEQFPSASGEQPDSEQKTEQSKKAQLISRYIETKVIEKNKSAGAEEEAEIKKYYGEMSAMDKANVLYEKMMAYMVDKQAEAARAEEAKKQGKENTRSKPDSYLISEIKILFHDQAVQDLLPETYGEARVDAKKLRLSELGSLWSDLREEIRQKEETYKELERNLHLNKISGRSNISSARSRMARLADNLSGLEQRKKDIETLRGFPETVLNTDTAAGLQYESLKEYHQQLKQGFVWLPSRRKIHQDTISAILNHRWPVLIGEAGSGKSEQADAAALELTGYPPTEIECESTTGEKQLIADKDIDPETGGGYDKYGPLMQAFTGFSDSRQKEPDFRTGRLARFDESGRLGPKAYSIIKKARQRKPGDDFYGHPVLPGAGAIWTSNPVGPRYPDRYAPDPAMRRELAEITVDYPLMSPADPELYEFALTALLDENNHIAVAKNELAPAYQKKEIPTDQREVLADGSIVIAKDNLIEDMASARHGALWRFCAAIKQLQDSFVYGNAETEKYPETLLRFKEDADGNIEITSDGRGEPLTLSTSTVTLGELASWMTGFNERRQKQNPEFRVDTLTEWLNFKINTYLKQADKADKEKIKAIFKHFHFLDNATGGIREATPLTPKQIGYLSPRVPRPLYLEKPLEKIPEITVRPEALKEIKEYETKQVLMEDGSRILIKARETAIGRGANAIAIPLGKKIRLKDRDFSFVGVIEDKNSRLNGMPVGQLANGEKLYHAFSSEELRQGIFYYELKDLKSSMVFMKK